MGNTMEVISSKDLGEGIAFERIRRITGYLVGTLDRFNNGKAAEERDRVKHGVEETQPIVVNSADKVRA